MGQRVVRVGKRAGIARLAVVAEVAHLAKVAKLARVARGVEMVGGTGHSPTICDISFKNDKKLNKSKMIHTFHYFSKFQKKLKQVRNFKILSGFSNTLKLGVKYPKRIPTIEDVSHL